MLRADTALTPVERGSTAPIWIVATVALLACAFGATGLIGSDILWLVPLGSRIAHGSLPHAIPFATAPSSGWRDVPAGAELVLWALYHACGGLRGLALAQAAAAAAGFGALAHGLRREGSAGATLLVSAVVLAGSLPLVVVADASLFSLALYPLLLALLEAESRRPSRRVWLVVPLLAIWGNLHGEVLTGLGLVACYLVFERSRRDPALSAVLLAASAASVFANAALWHTPHYYRAVLSSEVVRRGTGLWAPLSTGGFSIALLAAAAVLVGLACARGLPVRLWEAVALLGLAAATVEVARSGPWFLFLAAYPATRALRLGELRRRLLVGASVVLGVTSAVLLGAGPRDPGSVRLAALAAGTGEPVLAEPILGQQVALAGGRIWVDDPIDAFSRADQSLYLDWLDAAPDGAAAVSHTRYVLVEQNSGPGRLAAADRRLVRVAARSGVALYRVRPGA